MADKQGIAKLDEKLISLKIVSSQFATELSLVHKKMNMIVKKTGAILSDEIFEVGNASLRKWLLLLSKQGASQEKLTAYLRCGLAHLTYDYIESQYRQIGIDDLISRTLNSLKNRKLHSSFFKPHEEPKASQKASVGARKKKIVPIKKTAPVKKARKASPTKGAVAKKKSAKKPAAKASIFSKVFGKKKAAKKPASKKKVITKKAAPKKATGKKATTKKATPRKKAIKKTATKKVK